MSSFQWKGSRTGSDQNHRGRSEEEILKPDSHTGNRRLSDDPDPEQATVPFDAKISLVWGKE